MNRDTKKLPLEKREKLQKKLGQLAAKRAADLGTARQIYRAQVAEAKDSLKTEEREINSTHKVAREKAIKAAHRKPRTKKEKVDE